MAKPRRTRAFPVTVARARRQAEQEQTRMKRYNPAQMDELLDWLKAQGRDPLDIVFAPAVGSISDMQARDEQDRQNAVWDAELTRQFAAWPEELRARMERLIEKRVAVGIAESRLKRRRRR